jgi:hypothetical protein
MKRMVGLLLMLFFFGATQAQSSAVATTTLIAKETEHDFGKVSQGKPVYYSFTIINKGDQPLKLDNVVATCGCTTPEWSKNAIAPGGTAQIKVGFNAAAEGPFEKQISVQYNGDKTTLLKIKGTVWTPPAGPAPANAAVQFLKQQTQ